LVAIASRLADELGESVNSTIVPDFVAEHRLLDERLAFLQQHAALYKTVEGALKARSLKQLESELVQDNGKFNSPKS